MVKKEKVRRESVDRELVSMFLRMSPEERLRATDNAIRAILELKNSYQRRKLAFTGPRRNT